MTGSLKKNNESLLIGLGLFLFAFILYGNTISHSYNLDDSLVTLNHRLTSKGVSAIPEIFTSPYYEDDQGYAYDYRPVVLASFAIEYTFFGDNPAVSHFINVFLYALTIVLLYLTIAQFFEKKNIILPLSIVLLFLTLPLHTEVVASIKNRDEILSFFFGLASLNFFILYNKKQWFYIIFGLAFYALAIFSKLSILPFTVVIPFSILCFKQVQFYKYLLLVLSISILSVIVMPYGSFLELTVYLSLIIGVNFIFMMLFKSYRDKFINIIGKILLYFNKPYSYFKYDLPNNKFFSGNISIGMILIMLIVNAYLFYNSYVYFKPYYEIFPFLSLSALIVLGNKSVKHTSFFFLALFIGLFSYLGSYTVMFELFYVSLFLYLVLNANIIKYYIPHVILVFVLAYVLGNIGGLIMFSIVAYFLYVYKSNKLSAWISNSVFITVSIFFVAQAIFNYTDGDDFVSLISPFLILTSILLFYKSKVAQKSYVLAMYFLVAVFFLSTYIYQGHAYFHESDKSTKVVGKQGGVNKVVSNINENVSNKSLYYNFSTDRPINFVEMPLSFDAPWDEKVGTSAYILGEYLKLMVFPHPMSFYYGYAEIEPVGLDNPQAIISILIHLLLIGFAFYLLYKKKHLILSFGIVYYLACISMFSNLLYPVVGMMADRFTYVASLGFCIVLAYLLLKAFKIDISKDAPIRLSPKFLTVVVLILGAYSFKTIARNTLWETPLKLMEHDIRHLDKSAQAHNLLASFSMTEFTKTSDPKLQRKYVNQGVKHFKRATEIYPEFFNAWYDLGRANMAKGDDAEAVKAFKRVLEIDSTFTNAMVFIANIYQENNMPRKAVPYYEKVIRHAKRDNSQFYNTLSYTWFRLEEYDKAIEVGERAIKEHPNNFQTFSDLGKIYLHVGDTISAMGYLEQAFKIQQDPSLAGFLSKYYREKEDIKKANYYNSFTEAQ